MKRSAWPAIGIALGVLAGCGAQPDSAPENKTTSAQNENASPGNAPATSALENAASGSTQKPLPSDGDIRKQLIGAWVYLEKPPAPKPEKWECETDNVLSLDGDDSYAKFAEAGRWAVKNGTLVQTATTSLPDFDEEDGEEKPINPPRVDRWPIEEIDGDVLRLRMRGHSQWMFRCPEVGKG